MVRSAMWQHRDHNDRIRDCDLLNIFNAELRAHSRALVSDLELRRILSDLQKLKCITRRGLEWHLRESVETTFE